MQLPNGRDQNVPLRDLAPAPDTSMPLGLPRHNMDHHETVIQNNLNDNGELQQQSSDSLNDKILVEPKIDKQVSIPAQEFTSEKQIPSQNSPVELRRSSRIRKFVSK